MPSGEATVGRPIKRLPVVYSYPLNLLFLNRSYYPDVEATGQLLTELCGDLAPRHRVAVICGQPNFVAASGCGLIQRETHQQVRILRARNARFSKKSLLGRIAGLSGYLLLAAWAAFRHERPDVLIVETDPPVLGALGALLKSWHRCRLVVYLQDLYPEVGLATGRLQPGLLTAFLRWVTQFGFRHADRIIVLGEDMRERVARRGVDPRKIFIVPNWIDTQHVRPLAAVSPLRQTWQLDGQFVVMYSGNLGLSQSLEQVLHAAKELRNEPVRFVFVGEGAAKAALQARAADWSLRNVAFLPYQPKERLSESLGAADLHLIPLRRGLAGCIVPSKLYGILAAGKPYLAAVDADSEVARITRTEEPGLLIEPESAPQLVEAIRWCLTHRCELAAMGERGRRLAETQFDRRLATSRFGEIVEATVTRKGTPAPA
jgi:colanic acid biosynthesis glycosyl transferase WcaI